MIHQPPLPELAPTYSWVVEKGHSSLTCGVIALKAVLWRQNSPSWCHHCQSLRSPTLYVRILNLTPGALWVPHYTRNDLSCRPTNFLNRVQATQQESSTNIEDIAKPTRTISRLIQPTTGSLHEVAPPTWDYACARGFVGTCLI